MFSLLRKKSEKTYIVVRDSTTLFDSNLHKLLPFEQVDEQEFTRRVKEEKERAKNSPRPVNF